MTGQAPDLNIAGTYRTFARLEARGRSPQYEALAFAVAEDQMVREFLRSLPSGKRQPNLVFAAARYLLGATPDIGSLRMLIAGRQHELAAVVRARRTQTNEPARCATLLPALVSLPQPLALLEVGASAGLTLLADRYCYDYAGHRITGTDPAAPVLTCQPRGSVPLPEQVPVVAWRAGLDINPLDVTSDDDVQWLQCLLWPGEGHRAECLAAAIAVARRDPPTVHRGDLISGLPALAAQAPAEATLVIYHSAVLAYIDPPRRRQFADTVRELDAVWLSNEGAAVLPHIAMPTHERGSFVLVRDGTTPVAFTDPHGAWLHWLHGPA